MDIIARIDGNMNKFIAEAFKHECEICGSDIINHYNENNQLTRRMCSNETCPGKLANRYADLCKRFQVTEVGYKTALSAVLSNKEAKSALSLFLKLNGERSMPLYQALDCMYIYSLGEATARQEFARFESLEELTAYRGKFYSELQKVIPHLREMVDAGSLKLTKKAKNEFEALLHYSVCITGSLSLLGKRKRDQIGAVVAAMTKGLVSVTNKSSVSARVDILLSEASSTSTKYREATRLGIPIMTSKQFSEFLINEILRTAKEKGGDLYRNILQQDNTSK